MNNRRTSLAAAGDWVDTAASQVHIRDNAAGAQQKGEVSLATRIKMYTRVAFYVILMILFVVAFVAFPSGMSVLHMVTTVFTPRSLTLSHHAHQEHANTTFVCGTSSLPSSPFWNLCLGSASQPKLVRRAILGEGSHAWYWQM